VRAHQAAGRWTKGGGLNLAFPASDSSLSAVVKSAALTLTLFIVKGALCLPLGAPVTPSVLTNTCVLLVEEKRLVKPHGSHHEHT
jgi:hypothetical protein